MICSPCLDWQESKIIYNPSEKDLYLLFYYELYYKPGPEEQVSGQWFVTEYCPIAESQSR